MTFRSKLRVLAVVTAVGLVSAACGEDAPPAPDPGQRDAAEPSGTLRVFAFEDSIIPEVTEPFLAKYPGVELETSAFNSGDEALTKLESGFRADVVEVCIREVPRYTASGVLLPLETARLESWESVWGGEVTPAC